MTGNKTTDIINGYIERLGYDRNATFLDKKDLSDHRLEIPGVSEEDHISYQIYNISSLYPTAGLMVFEILDDSIFDDLESKEFTGIFNALADGKDFAKIVSTYLEEEKDVKDFKYRFLFIADTIEQKYKIESSLAQAPDKLRSSIGAAFLAHYNKGGQEEESKKILTSQEAIYAKHIETQVVHKTDNNLSNVDAQIRILSRVQKLEFPLAQVGSQKSDTKILAYGYLANLYDVSKLYKVHGTSIFSRNIRGKIDETLGVDNEIKSTLRNEPNNFVYFNNGLTLLVNKAYYSDLKSDYLYLKQQQNTPVSEEIEPQEVFSIINGAQTVTSVSEVFFGSGEEEKIQNKDPKAAYVFLRVILFDEKHDPKTDLDQFLNNITLAHNRQKPINQDDISYLSTFVQNVNRLYDPKNSNDFSFAISRQGEAESYINNKYYLVDIARSLTAWLEIQPGTARNAGRAALLKVENNNLVRNIFKPLSGDSQEDKNLLQALQTHYKPVNFSMRMSEEIDRYIKRYTDSGKSGESSPEHVSDYGTVVRYGKYHILCIIINYLNYESYTGYLKKEDPSFEKGTVVNPDILDKLLWNVKEKDQESNKVLYQHFAFSTVKHWEHENTQEAAGEKDAVVTLIERAINAYVKYVRETNGSGVSDREFNGLEAEVKAEVKALDSNDFKTHIAKPKEWIGYTK